jgi:short-subunit dehydrogenase
LNISNVAKNSAPSRVWITGASSGLGEALARYYASIGSEVILTARTESKLLKICDDLNRNVKAHSFVGDVTKPTDITRIVEQMEKSLLIPDLVILNAGTYVPLSVADFSAQKIRDLMELNYFGVIHTLEVVLPLFRKLEKGQIAVVSSLAAEAGLPFSGPYSASKAALVALCESLRTELSSEGVRICTVLPGFIQTPLTDKNEFKMPFMMTADRAASIIGRGLSKNKKTIRFPWQMSILMKGLSLLPSTIFLYLTRKMLP